MVKPYLNRALSHCVLGAYDVLDSARARDTAMKRGDKRPDLYRASFYQLRMSFVGHDRARL